MPSWTLVSYTLTAALRDRLLMTMVVAMILCTSLSIFMASAAVTEKNQFLVVFSAGSLRFVGVFGLVLFIVFFIRRSFESRDIEFLLAKPVGRVQLILSMALTFALIGIGMALVEGLCIYMLSPQAFDYGRALWMLSVMVENSIMAVVALFFSLILSSAAMAAMASFGLYVLARMMGQILGILAKSPANQFYADALHHVMQYISAVTPRLDLMGQSSWLIYGPGGDVGIGFLLAQGAAFTALILLAALIDFVRRQF